MPPSPSPCSSFAFITFSGPECVQKMLEDHACQPLTLDDKQVCVRVCLDVHKGESCMYLVPSLWPRPD